MRDFKEGMFFRVERTKPIAIAQITGGAKNVFNYKAIYINEDYAEKIPHELLEEAFDRNLVIVYSKGKFVLAPANFEPMPLLPDIIDLAFVHDCYKYKPRTLFMSELKWKLLIRNLIKGKNIMLTGHAGTGKTVAAKTAAKVLDRPFFMFRVGSMQDPRSSLIGNTFYNKERGTYFRASRFITAIQTPNAVILLDELSRAHPEAHNILLSVLDPEQKCISLDETDVEDGEDSVIKVAPGVSFVATANMGNEYTGTRQIDRANIDRFSYIEIDLLSESEELALSQLKFPNSDPALLGFLCKISSDLKEQYLLDNVSNMMSTRMVLEAAELIDDGFTIGESLDATIVPLFTKDGGAASERTYLLSMINKHVPKNKANQTSKTTKITPTKIISSNNPFNAAKK